MKTLAPISILLIALQIHVSVQAQESVFQLTPPQIKPLNYVNKTQKQVVTFKVKNTNRLPEEITPKGFNDGVCSMPSRSLMTLKPGETVTFRISCDLSKNPGEQSTFNRSYDVRLSPFHSLSVPVGFSFYDAQKMTMQNDSCDHAWRARCKDAPRKKTQVCFFSGEHHYQTNRNQKSQSEFCSKEAQKFLVNKPSDLIERLEHIYNDTCDTIDGLEFLNPKTVFGFENEDWDQKNLFQSEKYKCLFSAKAAVKMEGSDLGSDCVSQLYKLKFANQLSSVIPHTKVKTEVLASCKKSCQDQLSQMKDGASQASKCESNEPVKNTLRNIKTINDYYTKDSLMDCASFTKANQFLPLEKKFIDLQESNQQ